MLFKKKAILLIHGFVGGNYDFGNLPNELQIIGNFDVFTFTLPGHEKLVVKNVKYSDWINSAKEQIEFLIKNNYQEIYLIGHSMGGVIASYLASTYPQVKKLVLAAPAFRYFYFKDGKFNIKNIKTTITNIPEIFKINGPSSVIERISKTPIKTMLEFTKLVATYQDCVNNINCPTLIIHGLSDDVAPTESTEYVHNNITSSVNILVNIKGVNHDCFRGKSNNQVKELIIDFLKNNQADKKVTIDI